MFFKNQNQSSFETKDQINYGNVTVHNTEEVKVQNAKQEDKDNINDDVQLSDTAAVGSKLATTPILVD